MKIVRPTIIEPWRYQTAELRTPERSAGVIAKLHANPKHCFQGPIPVGIERRVRGRRQYISRPSAACGAKVPKVASNNAAAS